MAERYWNPGYSLDDGRFQQRSRDYRDERDFRDDRSSRDYDRNTYGSDYGSDPYRSARFGQDYDRPYAGRYEGRYGHEQQRYGQERYGQERYGQERYGQERFGQERFGQEHRDQGSIGDRVKDALGMERRPGPKGYRRSDERILDDVCFRLWANPDIDASEIEVEVKDCNVKLKGLVQERWMKRLAEDLVEDIFGVEDVDNELRVKGSMAEKVLGDTREKGVEQGAVAKSAASPSATAMSGSGTTRR